MNKDHLITGGKKNGGVSFFSIYLNRPRKREKKGSFDAEKGGEVRKGPDVRRKRAFNVIEKRKRSGESTHISPPKGMLDRRKRTRLKRRGKISQSSGLRGPFFFSGGDTHRRGGGESSEKKQE